MISIISLAHLPTLDINDKGMITNNNEYNYLVGFVQPPELFKLVLSTQEFLHTPTKAHGLFPVVTDNRGVTSTLSKMPVLKVVDWSKLK